MNRQLKDIIGEDKRYYYGSGMKFVYRYLTHNPLYRRGQYLILCRKIAFYNKHADSVLGKIRLMIYQRKRNILGEKLHIELGTSNFGRRLRIYHNDIVINAGVIIGDDCELYGNNCIGNKGSGADPLAVPIIGDNVSFGVGSNAIGNILICDNVRISSMSLVNKSINEAGLYGGVPAKMISKGELK